MHPTDKSAILKTKHQITFNFTPLLKLYLLIGVATAASMQFVIELIEQELIPWEAKTMVLDQPVIIFVFIWYFNQGLDNRS